MKIESCVQYTYYSQKSRLCLVTQKCCNAAFKAPCFEDWCMIRSFYFGYSPSGRLYRFFRPRQSHGGLKKNVTLVGLEKREKNNYRGLKCNFRRWVSELITLPDHKIFSSLRFSLVGIDEFLLGWQVRPIFRGFDWLLVSGRVKGTTILNNQLKLGCSVDRSFCDRWSDVKNCHLLSCNIIYV